MELAGENKRREAGDLERRKRKMSESEEGRASITSDSLLLVQSNDISK